jgi:hypothetical protein
MPRSTGVTFGLPRGRKTLTILALALVMAGCSGADRQPQPAGAAEAPPAQAADIASANPRVLYFHEKLIADGEDPQSDFGGDLLTLGMNARDLLQDDPQHAYDTVLEKVRTIEDATVRREMMRTFFDSDGQ